MVDLSADSLLEYDQIVNTTFSSENEGFDFYKSYALKKGFGVRRGYFEKDKANNQVCLRKIVCCQQGSLKRTIHMLQFWSSLSLQLNNILKFIAQLERRRSILLRFSRF